MKKGLMAIGKFWLTFILMVLSINTMIEHKWSVPIFVIIASTLILSYIAYVEANKDEDEL